MVGTVAYRVPYLPRSFSPGTSSTRVCTRHADDDRDICVPATTVNVTLGTAKKCTVLRYCGVVCSCRRSQIPGVHQVVCIWTDQSWPAIYGPMHTEWLISDINAEDT